MKLNLSFTERMETYEKGKYIYAKPKFGPASFTKIPKELNEDLACFIGIVIGDGNLKKDKQRITIELIDKKLLQRIQRLVFSIFQKHVNIHTRIDKRVNRKIRYYININSAVIYDLLNLTFSIPKGTKSNKVTTPLIILKSKKSTKKSFLVGILATDGGKRYWRQLGFSSASKQLRDTVSLLFDEVKIPHKIDKWKHKKYKKSYYGIYFPRENLVNLVRECRSGQTGQILDSFLEKTKSPSLGV